MSKFKTGDIVRRKKAHLDSFQFSNYMRKLGRDPERSFRVWFFGMDDLHLTQDGIPIGIGFSARYFELVNRLTLKDYLDDI